MKNKEQITVQTTVRATMETVWHTWTEPKHIIKWNSGSKDWHTPKAKNNLIEGGRFISRMEAKDSSMGFDFGGTYTKIVPQEHLAYTLDDGRNVVVDFKKENNTVTISETFQPETQNPDAMQRDGWQAILDNFKKYTEAF